MTNGLIFPKGGQCTALVGKDRLCSRPWVRNDLARVEGIAATPCGVLLCVQHREVGGRRPLRFVYAYKPATVLTFAITDHERVHAEVGPGGCPQCKQEANR